MYYYQHYQPYFANEDAETHREPNSPTPELGPAGAAVARPLIVIKRDYRKLMRSSMSTLCSPSISANLIWFSQQPLLQLRKQRPRGCITRPGSHSSEQAEGRFVWAGAPGNRLSSDLGISAQSLRPTPPVALTMGLSSEAQLSPQRPQGPRDQIPGSHTQMMLHSRPAP